MATATYVGAGLDIDPIRVMSEVREFIYVDSLPKSHFGMRYPESERGRFYVSSFIPRLNTELQNINFRLVRQGDNYLEYVGPSDQILKYYINTIFPNITVEAATDISKSEHLVLCGFDPDKSILSAIPNLKYIWCNARTAYHMSDSDFEDDDARERSTFWELRTGQNTYKYMHVQDGREVAYPGYRKPPA